MSNNDNPMYRLGIAAGSASIAMALLDENNRVVAKSYRLHHGDIWNVLNGLLGNILRKIDGTALCRVAACGVNRDSVTAYNVNEITALVAGARFAAPDAHSIMEIGGQSSKYIIGVRGDNIQFAINDTCSAGTGSFFEAQAGRLNIALETFSTLAEKANVESAPIPRIAGRCSVFAKTDIIHLQQGGEKIENILAGLCYATARNYKASVAGKLPWKLPTLFAGGTIYNRGMIRAIRDVFDLNAKDLIISEYAPYISAIGAALCTGNIAGQPLAELRDIVMPSGAKPDRNESGSLPPLLALDHPVGNLHKTFPLQQGEPCFLGIDIGSTSTNLVLIDQSCRVVDYQYLRTGGNPKNAVKQGFESLATRFENGLAISAVATTGSGRHFIGSLIGADGIYDEISAQAAAAVHFSPETDTVFEIGGQDSKYISIRDASVADFQMNKICAAGTGSFIEEQALKLDIPLDRFGKVALSAQAPRDLGERCTVFIETNVNRELSQGASKEDITAGLCYSVVKNYLHRVVANKPVGKHILLQGGVAYNSALVAAFKKEYGSRLEVAPYFSVSGAIGAALMVREKAGRSTSSFKGLACLEADEARAHDVKAADTPLPKAKVDPLLFNYGTEIDPHKKTIGIPRALIMYSLFPVFNAFFRALGYNVLISGESGEEIMELAQAYTKVEMCYPVKLAIGHAAQLAGSGVDYIFFPSLYALEKTNAKAPPGRVCVCMQKAPRILEASLGFAERGIRLLTMDIDLSKGYGLFMAALYRLGRQLEHRPVKCLNALGKGITGMFGYIAAYMKSYRQSQKKAAGEVATGKAEFVIISRGYCLGDPVLSLGLKEMLEERGCRVSYGVQRHKLNIYQQYPNLYWSFGTFLLKTAKTIAAKAGVYAVYPTYHGCGPDGMLSHWFEDEAGGKPCLSLEIDEHASKVGVITRLEAFINSVHGYEKSVLRREQHVPVAPLMRDISGFSAEIAALDKERPAIIPYCYPYSALFAAYLRSMGYNACELPPTSPESLARGRSYMRGKEYFSLTALLGDSAAYAETHRNAQLLFPQTGGVEVDGLYSYFVYAKLKDRLTVISPALDRMPEQESFTDALFRILLAGDIALYSGSEDLARVMEVAFAMGLPDDETLLRWARSSRGGGNRILITGEPWCIHNALFKKTIIEQVQAAGLRVIFAPVSEMLLFEWQYGGPSKITGKMEKLMYTIADVMEPFNVFSPSMTNLKNTADRLCGNFTGGFGRYRIAKAASCGGHVSGIISAVSQYENTGASLELLPVDRSAPFLSLQFDGDNNSVNQLKIDSFLDEIVKRKN